MGTYLYWYFQFRKKNNLLHFTMDSTNSDKITISKISIHQKSKSKPLEERLIKEKITNIQFFKSFIYYSNEKQSNLKRVKSQDLRKKILIYNVSVFANKLLETENEKERVQKRQQEIKKKLEICSNCSTYKIVCYCDKNMLVTKNNNYEEKSTNSSKRLKLDTYFNQALNIKYRHMQETMV